MHSLVGYQRECMKNRERSKKHCPFVHIGEVMIAKGIEKKCSLFRIA